MRPAGTKGISLFLIPKFLVNADGSLGERNDIYPSGVEHKLGMHASPTCTMTMGDKGGADRLPDRRGKPRHALHVHDDEPGPARRRPRRRRHRRPRLPAGAGVRAGTPPGPRHRQEGRRHGPHHRASRRQADADADAGADRRRAHHLLRHRGRDGCRHARDRRQGARRRHGARRAADADRKGVLHRHRQRGVVARRADPRRHGIYRGNRRRAALSRCPHHRDL